MSVVENEAGLSALVADIYDTVFEPAAWPIVLEKICAFVGGCAANVFSQDSLYNVAQVHYSWGDNPDYVRLYLEKYVTMNPFFPAIAFGEVGRVSMQSEIIPFDEFYETRFYREWVQPQGYVDCLCCLLEKSETGCAMITIRRDAQNGFVDDEAQRRLGLIIPHLRRAIVINRALEHTKTVTASLTDVFDRMATAIFLIGPERLIIYANAAGEALLARNELVSRNDGLLQARHHPTVTALFSALETAEALNPDGDSGGITLPLETETSEPYAAHVLPLSSGLRRRVGGAHGAVAAVFIRKATVAWASPAELVANLYKLTPSEIRVLLAVIEHAGVRQVAKTLGISEETVRSHLRHIFQKTGAKRQADLVKLLAGFASSPL